MLHPVVAKATTGERRAAQFRKRLTRLTQQHRRNSLNLPACDDFAPGVEKFPMESIQRRFTRFLSTIDFSRHFTF